MEYFPIFLLMLAIAFAICRLITVVLHELGHAIPAMLLTKQKVTIYIGSYGNPKGSFHFNVGLLEVWFRYHLLFWKAGLCSYSGEETSLNKKIIITLSGPLASLFTATIACYVAFNYNFHGSLKFLFVVLFCSSIVDLLINLIPNARPTKLYSGKIVYNDGHKLSKLFKYKRLYPHLIKAIDFYQEGKFEESGNLFLTLYKKGLSDNMIYQYSISSFLQKKILLKRKN